MTEREVEYPLEALELLEMLVHWSAKLRQSLAPDQGQEELIERLDSGLARLQKLIKSQTAKGISKQQSAEFLTVAGKFLFRIIELLTRTFQ